MYTPTGSHSVERRIRNSRFIARAEPLADPGSVKARVEALRAANPGCAHVVHAFSVGAEHNRIFGMSDDGEPHGTAGRPIIDVLKGSNVTNCLITVVRYFGGTKLGTGGLVRAYAGVAKEVLGGTAVETLVAKRRFSVAVPYELYEPVKRILLDAAADIEAEEFTETVRLEGRLPVGAAGGCAAAVRDATSGAVSLDVVEGA
ncbi:MAG: IMPACT family protein [Spirochaetaceae bacterium]